MYRSNVLVCGGTGCTSSNSEQIIERLREEIKAKGLEKEVNVVRTGCFGLCALGPIMIVYPEGSFYSLRDAGGRAGDRGGAPAQGPHRATRLLYQETVVDDRTVKSLNQTPFYAKQHAHRAAQLRRDQPGSEIDEYIAVDGYQALGKVLTEMTPQEVIDCYPEVGSARARRRGLPDRAQVELCGGERGGPEVRLLQRRRGRPRRVHGPLRAGRRPALRAWRPWPSRAMPSARRRATSTSARSTRSPCKRLQIAIGQAREYGLLGKNIFDSGFDFDIDIRLGAGAFVCGEETALMTSIEGKRGEPRVRPPFPAVKGLFGKPTVLNNVETYANIAQIILKGPEWFSSIGTEKSKGTKVFALGGKIQHTGLVEVPMGTTLREIVEEIGGGVPNGHTFKAAQTGGPSGGCIPAEHLLDAPIDYDNLIAIGSMMGSGGLIVMDDTTCMVDIAKFFLEFTVDESCGKCTPCRVGTQPPAGDPGEDHQRQRHAGGHRPPGESSATTSRKTRCAASARRRRTRCSRRCAISATSTSPM